jgi:hypothetical protein
LPEQVRKLSSTSQDSGATRVIMSGSGKEAEEMYHYMEFDPYLIREHNQQIFREVQALRLEKRLRKNHKARGSQLIAFVLRLKNTLYLLRKVGLAGR